jgi:hypothetical protein
MEHTRTRSWVLGLAAVVLLSAALANGQPLLPVENHYKVYLVDPPYPLTKLVGLSDQFGSVDVTTLVLQKFANPAEKILPDGTRYPMVDPKIHLTWWRISVPQPPRSVVGIDQFGAARWDLGDAVCLLNPALKDPLTPGEDPPVWNHYLCYNALGPTVGMPVTLVDQWGNCNVVVLYGKLFCNPVEKRADGVVYPIIDYSAHLACYLVQNPMMFSRTYVARDQFGIWNQYALQNDCLCVPALKDEIVGNEETTWGRIKALYR